MGDFIIRSESDLRRFAQRPFCTVSGKKFQVCEFPKISHRCDGSVRCECEYWLREQGADVVYLFAVRFHYTAFVFNRLSMYSAEKLIRIARHEIAEYLDSYRQTRGLSRREMPIYLDYYNPVK